MPASHRPQWSLGSPWPPPLLLLPRCAHSWQITARKQTRWENGKGFEGNRFMRRQITELLGSVIKSSNLSECVLNVKDPLGDISQPPLRTGGVPSPWYNLLPGGSVCVSGSGEAGWSCRLCSCSETPIRLLDQGHWVAALPVCLQHPQTSHGLETPGFGKRWRLTSSPSRMSR